MMRWVIAALCVPGVAAAQGLVLDGSSATDTAAAPQSCLSVQVGSAASYTCINAAQKALVAQQHASQQGLALNQNSDPNRLGLFNEAATKEHLGRNFGISSVPQLPPPGGYTSGLGRPPH